MKGLIELVDVVKTYPSGTHALDGVSLHIDKGEFVFVVGHSGAGKSTLIKMLLREEVPTTGEVYVNGLDLVRMKRRRIPYYRRSIGVVFQDFRLIPNMSVYENVAFSLRVTNVSTKYIRRRVPYILDLLGLTGKSRQLPAQISGGEMQRVALARALVNNPSLIIADEPTGNIDPQLSFEIVDLLNEINKKGTTVLMVTHEHNLVSAFDHRVITLDHGRVISDRPEGSKVIGEALKISMPSPAVVSARPSGAGFQSALEAEAFFYAAPEDELPPSPAPREPLNTPSAAAPRDYETALPKAVQDQDRLNISPAAASSNHPGDLSGVGLPQSRPDVPPTGAPQSHWNAPPEAAKSQSRLPVSPAVAAQYLTSKGPADFDDEEWDVPLTSAQPPLPEEKQDRFTPPAYHSATLRGAFPENNPPSTGGAPPPPVYQPNLTPAPTDTYEQEYQLTDIVATSGELQAPDTREQLLKWHSPPPQRAEEAPPGPLPTPRFWGKEERETSMASARGRTDMEGERRSFFGPAEDKQRGYQPIQSQPEPPPPLDANDPEAPPKASTDRPPAKGSGFKPVLGEVYTFTKVENSRTVHVAKGDKVNPNMPFFQIPGEEEAAGSGGARFIFEDEQLL